MAPARGGRAGEDGGADRPGHSGDDRLPQRFRTTAPGTGTGLGPAIVVGQTRLPGAESLFRNRPRGGAEAVLSLPASVAG